MIRILSIVLCLFLTACNHGKRSEPVPAPEAAPVVKGQADKDRIVTVEADNIDKKVKGSAVEADVKASTDAQRAVIKMYPAADVDRITKEYQATIDSLNKDIAAKAKQITDLQDAEKKKQVLWLRLAGIVAVVATAALVYFGLRAFAGLSATIAAVCLGMAQLISQPWFDTVFNWSIAAVAAAFIGVGLYEFRGHARKRALSSSEAAKAKETREALLVTVEHMDAARASLSEFSRFYDLMEKDWDWSEKEILKELRAEIAVRKVSS